MDSSDSSRAAARLLVLVPTLVLQLHQCGFSAINTIMGSVRTHKLEGPPLGFIALDIHFTRPPGDPWNEDTWPFPLLREYAEGSKEEQVVTSGKYDDAFLERFAAAGKRLADRGCVGIITRLTLQHRLAKRLPIPIATSSLLQVPSVLAILPPTKSLGIITYDADRFGYEHLGQLGVSEPNHHRIHIMGAPHKGHLQRLVQSGSSSSPTGKNSIPYVHADLETELIERSKELLSAHQDIGALLVLQRCSQKVSLLVEDLKPECNFGDDRPKLEGPRYCAGTIGVELKCIFFSEVAVYLGSDCAIGRLSQKVTSCLLDDESPIPSTNGAGSNGCLREKLRLTCPLQSDEESGGFRDRPTACQQAVVLEYDILVFEHTKVNGVRIDPERRRLNGIYSVTLICPLPPSANPSFAKIRNAPAICSSCHRLWSVSARGRGIDALACASMSSLASLHTAAFESPFKWREGCWLVVVVDIASLGRKPYNCRWQ
ncbi:hypothetical protein KC344_g73 [Hortaea werneckii]|nr:hypothetical protein KC344_g73 [Hortaea werneckii]